VGSIFHAMARADAEAAFRMLLESPEAVRSDGGVEGWIEMMYLLGRGDEVAGFVAQLSTEEKQEAKEVIGRVLLAQDPEAARTWLDGQSGEGLDWVDRHHVEQFASGSEEWLEAAQWYVARGVNEEDVAARVHHLAYEQLSGGVESNAILAALEARGIDVQPARSALFYRALSGSDYESAFARLEDVPSEGREVALARLVEQASRSSWIDLGENQITVRQWNADVQGWAEEAGVGAEYAAFIAEKNAEAAAAFEAWIDAQKGG
jgi:hypothetical protein